MIQLHNNHTHMNKSDWPAKLWKEQGSSTYNFDAVARSSGECPGACLLAWVFIGPVGAGNSATHTIDSVIAASCNVSLHVSVFYCQYKYGKCAIIRIKYLLYSHAYSHVVQSHSYTDSCSSQKYWHTHADSHHFPLNTHLCLRRHRGHNCDGCIISRQIAAPSDWLKLTWEELCFKALFWYSIIWFKLNAHVVILWGKSFWFFCPTELPM